jgi:D-xylose transport system ATP-binding protein
MSDKITLMLKNITKRFIGVTALDSVSFDVREGEVHAIVGENGAGKTTLMKILSGAYSSATYTGEIICNGRKVNFISPRQAQEAGIEMIYQEIQLIPDLSVVENVMVGNYKKKLGIFIDWNKMIKNTEEALGRVGLDIDPKEKVKRLSTSQQQMVAIAKAVLKRPKVLVLDEPTSSLTNNEREYLFNIIKELRASGLSCIYISHKIEEVLEISDRITIMRDGKIIETLNKNEFDINRVIRMMVGRNLDNRYPRRTVIPGKDVMRVKNLTVMHKFIKGRKIIDDVSFSLREREVLGIAGLVGAGRSELVNAIFGQLHPCTGYKIYIDGEEKQIYNIRDAIKNGIVLLTEDRRANGIIPALSIRENATIVSIGRLFKNGIIKKSREAKIIGDFIEKLNIKAPNIETKIKNLSGGNQQKVVMSKWLMQKPKIMILDEPTRGIDIGAKYEIYNIINELVRGGVSVIMISSELPELLGMCDRFLVLYNGKIAKEYSAEEVNEDIIMAASTGIDLQKAY